MSTLKIAILFGGKSAEHEISLISAQNIIKSLDRSKYTPILIAIDQSGRWYYQEDEALLFKTDDPNQIKIEDISNPVLFSPVANDHRIVHSKSLEVIETIDLLFPVLHGTYGEDGAIQGLAKLANLPCVGCGIIGSAVGMDKELMKKILSSNGILNAPYLTLRKSDSALPSYEELVSKLGTELFIKPANMGSSVGITHLKQKDGCQSALNLAFKYDHKVIVESRIIGREIECAVKGNHYPRASTIGEVIPKGGFYSYESKYIDESGATLEAPAKLSDALITKVQEVAIKTYKALESRGLSRVDMFLTPDGKIYVNEVNTLPGFTKISMYPTLWKLSGISNEVLVDELIQYALEEHSALEELEVKY